MAKQANRSRANRIRGTKPTIDQAAKRLRQQLTPAEAKMWSVLKSKQFLGLKFRCQHPVGHFILDFYCPSQKLVIEIDGEIHNQQKDYDNARTEELKTFGYKVLRFTNQEVLNNLDNVLAQIKTSIETTAPVTPWESDSPQNWGARGANAVSQLHSRNFWLSRFGLTFPIHHIR